VISKFINNHNSALLLVAVCIGTKIIQMNQALSKQNERRKKKNTYLHSSIFWLMSTSEKGGESHRNKLWGTQIWWKHSNPNLKYIPISLEVATSFTMQTLNQVN